MIRVVSAGKLDGRIVLTLCIDLFSDSKPTEKLL